MSSRYDLAMGTLATVAVGVFLLGIGVPNLDPVTAVVLAALGLSGVLWLTASRRPELTVAGRRVDYRTFRGLSSCSVGFAIAASGSTMLLAGDSVGIFLAVVALFPVATGVIELLRRPSLARDVPAAE